jgi:HlyD family secretion protein
MSWTADLGSWLGGLVTAAAVALGIGPAPDHALWIQGYGEADYVRIAAPVERELQTLSVERGSRVNAGDPLFALDPTMEQAARDAAAAELGAAQAELADLEKPERDPELEARMARIAQAEADREYAQLQVRRLEALVKTSAAARDRLDEARAQLDRNRALVDQLRAEHEMGLLGARADRIDAARARVRAAQAALVQTEHRLAEIAPRAPAAARVEDTHFRPGERVPAGRPVVTLLPPPNMKIRFFVPEPLLPRVRPGQALGWRCDGCPADLQAEVSFVASEAEFTPPVIYSVESRDKLVFMVEARPTGEFRPRPGQPVDVRVPPP